MIKIVNEDMIFSAVTFTIPLHYFRSCCLSSNQVILIRKAPSHKHIILLKFQILILQMCPLVGNIPNLLSCDTLHFSGHRLSDENGRIKIITYACISRQFLLNKMLLFPQIYVNSFMYIRVFVFHPYFFLTLPQISSCLTSKKFATIF